MEQSGAFIATIHIFSFLIISFRQLNYTSDIDNRLEQTYFKYN